MLTNNEYRGKEWKIDSWESNVEAFATDKPTGSNYQFINYLRTRDNSVSEILVGLLHPKKRIHPKFFYDDRGAELFDRITVTEDYYPTNAELEILQNNAADLAAAVGSNGVLVEPGCGSCTKVMALLPHLCPAMYVPIDIASQPLQRAAQQLVERFPYLRCTAIAADFVDLSFLSPLLPALPRTVFYPGSTIGNFEPADAIVFLRGLRAMIGRDGGLLIGVDKENSEDILNQAYNDREGITEKFNLNILENINRTAVANFEVRNFEHEAFYNASEHRVEMHLRSTCIQSVTVAGQKIEFTKGELIHTENSYKYSVSAFESLAAEAGFIRSRTWHDSRDLFSVHYFMPAC